jgi:hypothetical protein
MSRILLLVERQVARLLGVKAHSHSTPRTALLSSGSTHFEEYVNNEKVCECHCEQSQGENVDGKGNGVEGVGQPHFVQLWVEGVESSGCGRVA